MRERETLHKKSTNDNSYKNMVELIGRAKKQCSGCNDGEKKSSIKASVYMYIVFVVGFLFFRFLSYYDVPRNEFNI